ncbi:MAG: AtpZ/AtpI family protein [Catenulispora sp.]|nr:AtpZ/AtpI family protein [Catenulispora sp.]
MSSTQKPNPPRKSGKSERGGKTEKKVDPYSITGYLLSGMVLYGGLGWLIDKWAGTSSVFAPIGVVFGLAAGLFLTFRQLSVLERQEREELLRKRRELADQAADALQAQQQDPQDQNDPHDR